MCPPPARAPTPPCPYPPPTPTPQDLDRPYTELVAERHGVAPGPPTPTPHAHLLPGVPLTSTSTPPHTPHPLFPPPHPHPQDLDRPFTELVAERQSLVCPPTATTNTELAGIEPEDWTPEVRLCLAGEGGRG